MPEPINDTVATPSAIFGKEAVMAGMADHIAVQGLGPLITDAKWDRKELTLTVAAGTIVEAAKAAKAAGLQLPRRRDRRRLVSHEPRFQISYSMLSHSFKQRLRIITRLNEGEQIASITGVWPSANFLRARSLRPLRRHSSPAPAPHAHHDARQLEGPPLAQGLSRGGIPLMPTTYSKTPK